MQGWSLVITGHSLGAGVAALMALKLKDRFPGVTPHPCLYLAVSHTHSGKECSHHVMACFMGPRFLVAQKTAE